MDKYEQLNKIQKLKEQGVLSEEEFNIEKNKILNLTVPVQNKPVQKSQQVITEKKTNSAGIVGFILSLLGGFNWYLTLPLGIIAFIFSLVGVSKNSKTHKKGLAITGLIFSILLILFGIFYYIQLLGHESKTGAMSRFY